MLTRTHLLHLAGIAMLTFQPLSAAPLAVGDFSFEGNSLVAGDYNNYTAAL